MECCRWSWAAFLDRNWCFQLDLGGPEGLWLRMADVTLWLETYLCLSFQELSKSAA